MNAEVRIAEIGARGQGVGFDDAGNVYFVPGALPGDVVRVSFEEGARRYRDAELVELIAPSAARQAPACRYFAECGGCDWLQWSYPAQLEAKQRALCHVLERAGLPIEAVRPILGAKHPLGYRNRVQLRREGEKLGFFRRGSRSLVDVESCAVARPKVNEKLAELRKTLPTTSFEKAEIVADEEGNVQVAFDSPHAALGFTQVNEEQNAVLREVVAESLRRAGASRVLELFCGNGNLTLAYLPFVKEALAYDSSEFALGYARRRFSPDAPVRFRHAEIDASLASRLPESFKGTYDTLLLDPPRRGVGRSLESFLHGQLLNVIYVSCSPVTFSQEARLLVARGFRLESVTPLDMFPQTHHLELVATFSRS